MNAIVRRVQSQKRDVEPQRRGEGLAKASRPAPMSNLGLRVVGPCQVSAVIEQGYTNRVMLLRIDRGLQHSIRPWPYGR